METPKKSNGIKHILKAIASGLVWGLGQVFNRQYAKALFFFLFMVVFLTIELMSGSYFTDYSAYGDLNKFAGGTVEDGSNYYGFNDNMIDKSTALLDRGLKNDKDFVEFYNATKSANGKVTMEDLVKYTANNLKINNPESFIDILGKAKTPGKENQYKYLRSADSVVEGTDKDYSTYQVLDLIEEAKNGKAILVPRQEEIFVDKATKVIYHKVTVGIGSSAYSEYVSSDGQVTKSEKEMFGYETIVEGVNTYYTKDGGVTKYTKEKIVEAELTTTTRYQFVNVSNSADVIAESDFYDCKHLIKKRNVLINDSKTKVYIEAQDAYSFVNEYLELNTYSPNEYPLNDAEKVLTTKEGLTAVTVVNDLYLYNGVVYEYYNPDYTGISYNTALGYQPTNFSRCLYNALTVTITGMGGERYTKADMSKFFMRIYFEIRPDVREDFETRFDNFYNDQSGFFLKGLWSCITLGETDREEYTVQMLVYSAIPVVKNGGKFILENVPIQGHTSTYLLINGLISTICLCFFVFVWVWSIRDAYVTSRNYEKTGVKVTSKEYFKDLYETAFEYIVLLPAIIVVAFISVMPILFSFLIAFTNYKSNIRLVDWVGLNNFVSIFSFGNAGDITIPFGKVFWGVLWWTIIWAVFSTVTVFFGGFFQALIINNERVPFKKFWRTVLILPWAIPALISQMMFSIIFQETGIINHVLNDVGIYDILKDLGILGVKYQDITSSFVRMFYLGEENIQWFTNPYNKWFVRITLIVVNIWLGFPYYMALMSGIMTGIDKTLYEAAEIDGATKGQRFKYVTFPLVMYSTAPLLVMAFSGNFNNFGMIYFVTSGGAHAGDIAYAYAGDTDILISWMYSLTVDQKIYNMASVFSILIFIVVGSIAAWNYSQTKAFKED